MFLSFQSHHELNGINDSPETGIICSGKVFTGGGLQNPEKPCICFSPHPIKLNFKGSFMFILDVIAKNAYNRDLLPQVAIMNWIR